MSAHESTYQYRLSHWWGDGSRAQFEVMFSSSKVQWIQLGQDTMIHDHPKGGACSKRCIRVSDVVGPRR